MISIDKIKALRDLGHTIDTLIQMLEKKERLRLQNRHWFIVEDGRNICEFCRCAYNFCDSESECKPE